MNRVKEPQHPAEGEWSFDMKGNLVVFRHGEWTYH